jgi:hypothetical protein
METIENIKVICEFCNKEFCKKSVLNLHQKSASYCLEIQKKNNLLDIQVETKKLNCEHCNKEFSSTRYLNQHVLKCKKKIAKKNNEDKENIENMKKEYLEMKIYSKVKDETINKLQKDYEKIKKDYEKLKKELSKVQKELSKEQASKSTTNIYTNKIVDKEITTNTSYNQVQYNQMCDKILPLTEANIKHEINKMPVTFVYQYDHKNIETSFYKNLTNIFKNFIFCIDKKLKLIIYKDNDDKAKTIDINEFINIGIKLGIKDIQHILDLVEKYYNNKLDNYTINEETHDTILESLTRIRDFITNSNIDFNNIENDHLKELPGMVISNIPFCKL